MKGRKISVIVPAKNEEHYIESCLRSVRNQTLDGLEVIVSDSCSTDRTLEIARRYADKIVKGARSAAQARNAGARAASGDILVFLDSDSVIMPDSIEKITGPLSNRNIVASTCPPLPMTTDAKMVALYILFSKFSKSTLKTSSPQISAGFCAYKRKAFQELGGFDENVKIFEDLHLSSRISGVGKVAFVDSTLFLTSHRRFKRHGISLTAKYVESWMRMKFGDRNFSSRELHIPIR